jgi:hypothetical protein
MGSSKSGIIFTPPKEEERPITVLPSSKSISPILENPRPQRQEAPAQKAAEPKPENKKP